MKSITIIATLLVFCACKEADNKVETSINTSVTAADTTLKWVDYRMGELPPPDVYFALDSTIKKWGIRYERIEGGCEMLEDEKKVYEKDNYKYFAVLEKQFGKDWRQRFDAEVATLDSILEQKNFFGKAIPHVVAPVAPPEIPHEPISCFPPKAVECINKGGDMEKGFTEECFWMNHSLEEAYDGFREKNKDNDDGKYLEKKMPQGHHIAGFDEYPLSITYKLTGGTSLAIELHFPGGITHIQFKKENKGVKVTTIHSPD